MDSENEIIIYEPDDTLKLDVRVENETVWLNRNQLAELFGRDVKTIGKHIANALKEELDGLPVVAKFATTAKDGKTYLTEHYNLEMVTSVGYRVKSQRGIRFRQWANTVLKDYMLNGYAVNQRFAMLENRIDARLFDHETRLRHLDEKVDFVINSSLLPKEGVFYQGEIFDAYVLMTRLIRSAKDRLVIIDNYLDESVLTLLSKRASGVKADIYGFFSKAFMLDVNKHNAQYPPVELHPYQKAHDRFMIVDETVYHVGASFKDLGKKLFAFSKMEVLTGTELLNNLNR